MPPAPLQQPPTSREFAAAESGVRAPSLLRSGWGLLRVAVAGLLVAYWVGWFEDVERVSRLSAEASPVLKKVVVTKAEAWDRITRSLPRGVIQPLQALEVHHDFSLPAQLIQPVGEEDLALEREQLIPEGVLLLVELFRGGLFLGHQPEEVRSFFPAD